MAAVAPKVVIVGAGFGGLTAAQALARAPVDVTVVDRHNFHYFQPLLYQVATAALSPADIAWPIRSILRRQKNATVLMANVTGVDPHGRLVHAGAVTLPYDYLVLATGATHSYFGHPEWAPAAPGLKQIEDATRIRRKVLTAFEQAELIENTQERRRLLTFVVVGGRPDGRRDGWSHCGGGSLCPAGRIPTHRSPCRPRDPHRGGSSPAAALS
jgi:NADH dehydrogenase